MSMVAPLGSGMLAVGGGDPLYTKTSTAIPCSDFQVMKLADVGTGLYMGFPAHAAAMESNVGAVLVVEESFVGALVATSK